MYIKSVGISSIPITKFIGNRFNCLFYNAAGTFYLAKHLEAYMYLKKKLAFLSSINLGIIGKLINEPYWEFAADDSKSAIDMSNIYNRLVTFLKICIENPKLPLENKVSLLFGPSTVLDDVSKHLFLSSNLDEKTELYIKQFCMALKLKVEVLFKDFLPNGKLYEPDENIIIDSETCAPNNITVERLMAKLDTSIKSSPNSNTCSMENAIMFRNNKTNEWLHSKCESDENNIIKEAMINKSDTIIKNKKREDQLYKERVKIIDDKIKVKHDQDERKKQEREAIQVLISTNGIWNSEEEIEKQLDKAQTREDKIQQLKSQINIYKDKQVLPISPDDNKLLMFSQKGKQSDVLIEMQALQNRSAFITKNFNDDPQSLVNSLIAHTNVLGVRMVEIQNGKLWEIFKTKLNQLIKELR